MRFGGPVVYLSGGKYRAKPFLSQNKRYQLIQVLFSGKGLVVSVNGCATHRFKLVWIFGCKIRLRVRFFQVDQRGSIPRPYLLLPFPVSCDRVL